MTFDLDLLRLAQASASHAGQRQKVVAENIANADTPGYRARDIKPFHDIFNGVNAGVAQKHTRAGHLYSDGSTPRNVPHVIANAEHSPNGNSVSLETEMTRAAEIRHDYDLALGIYSKSLDILRKSMGRG